MTQLPEAEVLRKELEKEVVGKRVKDVEVGATRLVQRHRNRPEFVRALTGRKIASVVRRGVRIVCELDEGQALVVGLGPTGWITRETANADPAGHVRARIWFTTGGALHVADPDDAAELFVVETASLDGIGELTPTGVDPLANTFTWHAFGSYLAARRRELALLLRDETFVIGLGDRYSDEVLWAAGLDGARTSNHLSSQEVRRLHRALFEVLYEAVKQGGSGGQEPEGDELDEDEPPAAHIKVHGRAAQPCPRCRRPIHRDEVDGHPMYHCPSCQT
ncbi:hypothetical protein ER308_05105 [Egibacter rhizosphaerae]|uniref:Uncharacterized protein n=1 Tax=Egibacter rhizosphaerae TaxID=1670831 RepID=A0A411YCU4_9ACTN|nr:DNA-formamidopyrimidine glycosylase family protein [Egibacter rhizosphaerae]QBI18982.1 hypothetical protein ER308_05105 [Egibacter rhizosphaerae]